MDFFCKGREEILPSLVDIMHSPQIIKAMCGIDNDVFRLRKELGCFPVGVVDLQAMFLVWKMDSLHDCYETCRLALM